MKSAKLIKQTTTTPKPQGQQPTTRPKDFVQAYKAERATPATARKAWAAIWTPKKEGSKQ